MLKNLGFILFLFNIFLSPARSDQKIRPENEDDFAAATDGNSKIKKQTISHDSLVRIEGASVAYANYEAIKRDFPFTASWSDPEIDKWILDNFALISKEQLKLNGIRQSDILPKLSEERDLFSVRRPGDDRAGFVKVNGPDGASRGLIGIKGLGLREGQADLQISDFKNADGNAYVIDSIRTKDHNDGLMSLGEATAEVTRQTAIQMFFDISNVKYGTRYETIESYFIISLPFEILKNKGAKIPAALYARQADFCRRYSNNNSSYKNTNTRDIYSDDYGGKQSDGTGAAIDFGATIVRDQRLASNYLWNDQRNDDAQASKPWTWGHETAEAYYYKKDFAAIRRHVEEMISPILQEWLVIKGAADEKRIQTVFQTLAANLSGTRRYLDNSTSGVADSWWFDLEGQKISVKRLPNFGSDREVKQVLEEFLSKSRTDSPATILAKLILSEMSSTPCSRLKADIDKFL